MAKKVAYPVILKPDQEGYYVEIPDFDIATEGDTIAEAMEMARDAIGLMGIDMEDEKKVFQNQIQKLKMQKQETQ